MGRTIYEFKVMFSCQGSICCWPQVSEDLVCLSISLSLQKELRNLHQVVFFWRHYFSLSQKEHWTSVAAFFTNKTIVYCGLIRYQIKQQNKADREYMLAAYQAQLNLNLEESIPIFAPLQGLKEYQSKANSLAPIICEISSKIFWCCDIRQ